MPISIIGTLNNAIFFIAKLILSIQPRILSQGKEPCPAILPEQ